MKSLSKLPRALWSRLAGAPPDHAEVYARISRNNSWGSPESASGPGSTRARGGDFSQETTTFVGRSSSADIRTGSWRPLNLQAAPFGFPPPLHAVDEHCRHSGGICRDQRLEFRERESLPTRPLAG